MHIMSNYGEDKIADFLLENNPNETLVTYADMIQEGYESRPRETGLTSPEYFGI